MAEIIEKTAEGLDKWLDNLGAVSDTYINLEGVVSGVTDLFINQAKEIRVLNKELGNGSKTSAELRGQFASLSAQLGVTSRETMELLNVTKSYHQGVKENTAVTLQFIKASGASNDIVGKMTARMNILGNVSEESLSTMYENILAVRDAYGLTIDQLDTVISMVDKFAVITQASEKQVSEAATILAKFTSQLTSAGMEAEEVADIIDSMIDPDRLTNNLVLMNKLGVSMTDMVSGDPVAKLENSAEKLKELGQEISNIAKTNRLQANEVAKVYGLTLEKANMLANIDTSEGALNTEKTLSEYRQEITTFGESIKNLTTILSGVVSGPLSVIGKTIEGFTNAMGMLPRGIQSIVGLITGKVVISLLKKGLEGLMTRAAKRWSDAVGEYLPKVQEKAAAKSADVSAKMSKRAQGLASDYGWGMNYNVKAHQRREEFDRGVNIRNKKLSQGEMVEMSQGALNRINKIKVQGALMDPNSREYSVWEKQYGALIKNFEKNNKDLLENLNKVANNQKWDDKALNITDKFGEDFNKQDRKTKAGIIQELKDQLKNEIKLSNVESFGLDNENAAKIAGLSSGPKDFMEKLIEFWKESDDPKAAEYISNITQSLNKFNDTTAKMVDSGNLKKLLEEANEIENNGKKGIKGRVGAFFGGIGTDIGTFTLKIVDKVKSAFSPKNLLKTGLKGVLGGLGLAGGFAVKNLLSSLAKNEEFQKDVATITEQVSKIFTGLTESIEPMLKPITNGILWFLGWIQPAIKWLTGVVAKFANWFGGKLDKAITSISDDVSTISDTYKQEDLKTMIGGAAVYDSTNKELLARLDDIYYKVVDVTKKQDTAADTAIAGIVNGSVGGTT